MGLWTPANLVTAPRYIFDPTTFTYSGSNFSSGTNGGSVGGSWTAEAGTAAKGTQLNGLDVIDFTGTQSLLNSTAAWPASTNVFVFAVAKVGATHTGGLVSHSWNVSDATHSWVYYPRAGAGLGGSANEGWMFQGTGLVPIIRGDIFTDTSYHIVAVKLGSTAFLDKDGTAITPTLSTTGTINATINNNLRLGATNATAGEPLTGSVAYLALLVDPTTDEIQKLEGWAAWKYGLVAQLDAAHPYKSAAPTDGIPPPILFPNPVRRRISNINRGYCDASEYWLIGQDTQFGDPGEVTPTTWPLSYRRKPSHINRGYYDSSEYWLIGLDTQFGDPGQVQTQQFPNPIRAKKSVPRGFSAPSSGLWLVEINYTPPVGQRWM